MAKVIDEKTAEKHWRNGLIDNEIEKEMKLQHGKIGAWRRKNGLPSNAGIRNWDDGTKGTGREYKPKEQQNEK